MSLFWKCVFRALFSLLLAGALQANLCAQTAAAASDQTAGSPPASLPQSPPPQRFVLKDYSKPKRSFPNVIAPYTREDVPPPDLTNTPRIEQLMREGKIYLSMDDAVALALEN